MSAPFLLTQLLLPMIVGASLTGTLAVVGGPAQHALASRPLDLLMDGLRSKPA